MDTDTTVDQQSASSSTTARTAEEFSGHDSAAIEQILRDSLDARAKSPNATTDAPSLAEQFAGIVYFSEMAADTQRDRRSSNHRTTRGRRPSTRPWRITGA
ncbi:hypothetical protein G5C66_08855 [Nocardioides sp. KC13]|uniref:Uncharacterized protein n=1 Tax=Nocardioides turkmenicus TaxID=2711220 RepID=A0A6M1R2D3_9ACTN|nr:hypothetical protein [Nocardioides sp. KC13]NGN92841.1 hypothetical protein [Nocardioides sp. KC13]